MVFDHGRVGYWWQNILEWIATCLRKPLASALIVGNVGITAHCVAFLFLFLDWAISNISELIIILELIAES